MMDSYDLFSAMSGADEELVARSDQRAKHHRSKWIVPLGIAACFAILLIGFATRFDSPSPDTLYTPPTTAISAPVDTEPAIASPTQPQQSGSNIGTLQIIQLSHTVQELSMPEFRMNIDSENYYLADDGQNFYIYQKSRTEGKPACWLTLTWEAGSTPEQALNQQNANLSALRESVTVFESNPLLDGPMLQGSSGSDWDSAQTEVYIVSDRNHGVFIFTLEYYLEDTDGHAIRFRDMLQTFEVITEDQQLPDWMVDLRSSVKYLTAAFLKNDFSEVYDRIDKNAEISTYGQDVLSGTRILKTQYTVDSDTAPTTATVSVRHKYAEADAYDYISMELKFTGGKWQVVRAMIER